MNKRLLLTALLVPAMLLAGCAAASMQAPAEAERAFVGGMADQAMIEPAMEAPSAPMQDNGVTSSIPGSAAPVDRVVIRTASLSIVVADPAISLHDIGKMAEDMGGFVVNANLYKTSYGENLSTDQGSITVRVPAERLDEALETIKAGAHDVNNEVVSGEDVTQTYTDLQSRLRNLEAAEAQLQEIMGSATKTEDVLAVYNQLVSVREQIEVLKGQIRYYDESAAFSAISVDLIPDVLDQPIDIAGWHPEGTAKQAVQSLIRGLQSLGDILIYGVICVVPFGLIFGLPAYFIVRAIVRRRRNARRAAKAEPPAG
jgi:hypothetical protein